MIGRKTDKGLVRGLKQKPCPNKKCHKGTIEVQYGGSFEGRHEKCPDCRGFGYILSDK
jgi:hypothetical protein